MRALVWFRSDLRVEDNPALHHACRDADRGVVALFIVSPKQWKSHDWGPPKVDFILRSLAALRERLDTLNISLLVRTCDTFDCTPDEIADTLREHECDALYFNREYEVHERRRDDAVIDLCRRLEKDVHCYTDQVIIPPGEVLTSNGDYYGVFSPFRKACYAYLEDNDHRSLLEPLGNPKKQSERVGTSDDIPGSVTGFESARDSVCESWKAGEQEAKRRLTQFCKSALLNYKDDRNFPATDGTSALSPYLTVGVISPRLCVHAAIEANGGQLESGKKSIDAWICELFWREFYRHVMVGYPRVSMGRAFREDVDRKVNWRYDESEFDAWCTGRTGYPIVDAGMRQLLETGWMHNRVRMITAMFLTKHLLIDWRWGEKHFMQHLIDGDLASNNGGWQWSASTGTDAAPYFRIFNPWTQSAKFDADGQYIRRFVPELREVELAAFHDPKKLSPMERSAIDYPEPIVDHAKARERALAAFKREG